MRRLSGQRRYRGLLVLLVTWAVSRGALAAPGVRLVFVAPEAVQADLRGAFEQQFAGRSLDLLPLEPLHDETPE